MLHSSQTSQSSNADSNPHTWCSSETRWSIETFASFSTLYKPRTRYGVNISLLAEPSGAKVGLSNLHKTKNCHGLSTSATISLCQSDTRCNIDPHCWQPTIFDLFTKIPRVRWISLGSLKPLTTMMSSIRDFVCLYQEYSSLSTPRRYMSKNQKKFTALLESINFHLVNYHVLINT